MELICIRLEGEKDGERNGTMCNCLQWSRFLFKLEPNNELKWRIFLLNSFVCLIEWLKSKINEWFAARFYRIGLGWADFSYSVDTKQCKLLLFFNFVSSLLGMRMRMYDKANEHINSERETNGPKSMNRAQCKQINKINLLNIYHGIFNDAKKVVVLPKNTFWSISRSVLSEFTWCWLCTSKRKNSKSTLNAFDRFRWEIFAIVFYSMNIWAFEMMKKGKKHVSSTSSKCFLR